MDMDMDKTFTYTFMLSEHQKKPYFSRFGAAEGLPRENPKGGFQTPLGKVWVFKAKTFPTE